MGCGLPNCDKKRAFGWRRRPAGSIPCQDYPRPSARERKNVTLLILWTNLAANPGGYSYSRFCELYRSFEKRLSVTMRQTHAAGERLFVDYAGDGVPVVIDRLTGEIRMAQISSRCWERRASPLPRRPGRRRCPTGSTPMCAPSRRSAAFPNARQRQDRHRQGQPLRS